MAWKDVAVRYAPNLLMNHSSVLRRWKATNEQQQIRGYEVNLADTKDGTENWVVVEPQQQIQAEQASSTPLSEQGWQISPLPAKPSVIPPLIERYPILPHEVVTPLPPEKSQSSDVDDKPLSAAKAMEHLKRQGYLNLDDITFGILLGIDAKSLCQAGIFTFNPEEQCLYKALECVSDLSIKKVTQALDKSTFFKVGSGLKHGVLMWASANNMSLSQPLVTSDKQQFIHYLSKLLLLQKHWKYFACSLDVPDYRLHLIEYQVNSSIDCREKIDEIFRRVNPITVEMLANAFTTRCVNNQLLKQELLDWASRENIALKANLHDSHNIEVAKSIALKVVAKWWLLALALNVKGISGPEGKAEQGVQKVLCLAEQKGLLSERSLVLALYEIGELRVSRKLASELGISESTLASSATQAQQFWVLCSKVAFSGQLDIRDCFRLLRMRLTTEEQNFLFYKYTHKRLVKPEAELAFQLLQGFHQGQFTFQSLLSLGQSPESKVIYPDLTVFPCINAQQTPESAILSASDLFPLVSPIEIPLRCFLLLGMVFEYDTFLDAANRPTKDERIIALNIWKAILIKWPLLQTGHLKSLFVGELEPYKVLLPNEGNIDNPTVSLTYFCHSVEERLNFVLLCENDPVFATEVHSKLGISHWLTSHNYEQKIYKDLPLGYQVLLAANRDQSVLKRLNAIFYDPQLQSQLNSQPELVYDKHLEPKLETGHVHHITEEDEDIPHKYMCPISLDWLEDPIPILCYENQKTFFFSRKVLLECLSRKPENPIDRTTLAYDVAEKTPVDEELQAEIAQWREQQKSKASKSIYS